MNVHVGVAAGAVHPFSIGECAWWKGRDYADRARFRLRHPTFTRVAPC